MFPFSIPDPVDEVTSVSQPNRSSFCPSRNKVWFKKISICSEVQETEQGQDKEE